MIGHDAAHMVSAGRRSTWPTLIIEGAATFLIVAILFMIAGPTLGAIEIFKIDRVDMARDPQGGSALPLRLFTSTLSLLVVASAYHVDSEHVRGVPKTNRGLALSTEREATLRVEFGIVRAIRLVLLPSAILDGFARLLASQLVAYGDLETSQQHRENARRYHRHFSNLPQASDLATIDVRLP